MRLSFWDILTLEFTFHIINVLKLLIGNKFFSKLFIIMKISAFFEKNWLKSKVNPSFRTEGIQISYLNKLLYSTKFDKKVNWYGTSSPFYFPKQWGSHFIGKVGKSSPYFFKYVQFDQQF